MPHLSTSSGDFDDIPQIIVYFIMHFMRNLEAILLQIPITDRHPEYAALFERVAGFWWDDELNEPSGGVSTPPDLGNIKTLYLQGDPEMLQHFETDDCDCDTPDIWGVQARRYWPLYHALTNLTTLEVSADDGVWHNVRPRGPDGKRPAYLQGIKHIYLHDSIACPRNMYQVLRNAPQLQTLYMVPRRDDAFLHGPEEDSEEAHPEALDNALLRRATTLRELDVAWWDCAGYESLIGPQGRLSNLPKMTAMEKLCVQLAVLYGTDQQEMLHRPLVDLLPPNLVELTLEEWWWGDIDDYDYLQEWCGVNQAKHWEAKANYRSTALGIMRGFARSCRERMPRLKRVSFMTRLPWTWKLQGRVDLKSHFGEVAEIFGRQGIEFSVEEIL
ncbi:hypothetical protein DL546_006646 [Coniochaeta pulveracea]|uniref:Uncharacterized protein n=1 Tax=Coniochaeta pulveracea TaxID=177199 RepID=A0A420YIW5_9PEZI|nr:hypothetical protein DL546_006646 [Coniochaeta pulveracea]